MMMKYKNDAFFRIKLDLKVKKITANKLHHKMRRESAELSSENEEQMDNQSFVTLKCIKTM